VPLPHLSLTVVGGAARRRQRRSCVGPAEPGEGREHRQAGQQRIPRREQLAGDQRLQRVLRCRAVGVQPVEQRGVLRIGEGVGVCRRAGQRPRDGGPGQLGGQGKRQEGRVDDRLEELRHRGDPVLGDYRADGLHQGAPGDEGRAGHDLLGLGIADRPAEVPGFPLDDGSEAVHDPADGRAGRGQPVEDDGPDKNPGDRLPRAAVSEHALGRRQHRRRGRRRRSRPGDDRLGEEEVAKGPVRPRRDLSRSGRHPAPQPGRVVVCGRLRGSGLRGNLTQRVA
jgi:hypothetical protein